MSQMLTGVFPIAVSSHTASGGVTGTAWRVPGLHSLQDPRHSMGDHIWDGDAEPSSQQSLVLTYQNWWDPWHPATHWVPPSRHQFPHFGAGDVTGVETWG